MELTTYFSDFLEKIRPTDDQANDLRTGHTTLIERLHAEEKLEPLIVSTFLQGSYRRGTIVKPSAGKRSDVDVVVVTKLSDKEFSPDKAIKAFLPFVEKHYGGKYKLQGRSIGIELSYVELDLVVTAAPSEQEVGFLKSHSVQSIEPLAALSDWRLTEGWIPQDMRRDAGTVQFMQKLQNSAEWKLNPLLIPDRDANKWVATHPLQQMQWTRDKNRRCNTHYINVVKCLKWWQRNHKELPKYPKGYPLEHMIGACCPDGITSVAEGIVETLTRIVQNFSSDVASQRTPSLKDHGVEQNVMTRVHPSDFADFYKHAEVALKTADVAIKANSVYESAAAWRELLGPEFDLPLEPKGSSGSKKGGFTEPTAVPDVTGGRYG